MASEKIRLAIIDSGLNLHKTRHPGLIKNGIGYNLRDDKIVTTEKYIEEENLHGTWCVNIIQSFHTDIDYYIVKILSDDGRTYLSSLEEAIRYCIEQNMDIINMSVGIFMPAPVEDLIYNIAEAVYKNIIVVASGSALYAIPAHLPGVITVVDEGIHTSPELNSLSSIKYDVSVAGEFEYYDHTGELTSIGPSTSIAAPYVTALLIDRMKRNLCHDYWSAIGLLKDEFEDKNMKISELFKELLM